MGLFLIESLKQKKIKRLLETKKIKGLLETKMSATLAFILRVTLSKNSNNYRFITVTFLILRQIIKKKDQV